MNLEMKDILAIWGAATATVGVIVAIHVWRLNKRLTTPRILISRAAGKIVGEHDRGFDLRFRCSLASRSNVAATVERFELDFGRKLNGAITTWARYNGAVRPRLTHCTTPGAPGSPFGKPGDPGDWDRPVLVTANGCVPSVNPIAKVYAASDADAAAVRQLKDRLRSGRYRLIACLAGGGEALVQGTEIELAGVDDA